MNNLRFLLTTFFCITVVSIAGIYLFGDDKAATSSNDDALVVTSFYPVYVAAENLLAGVDGVALENLSEPQMGCLHDYVLTPGDMKLLSEADVFVVNGGGIESFLTDVARAYPELRVVDSGSGLTNIQADAMDLDSSLPDGKDSIVDEDEPNAHYWMSVSLYEQQIETMRDGLCGYFSEKASSLKLSKNDNAKNSSALIATNASNYLTALHELQDQQTAIAEKLAGIKVILFHEAYEYVADDYGMEVAYLLDLDEERQVSAGEVADVMRTIGDDGASLILAEEQYGKEMGDLVAEETGVGVIYLDTIVRGENNDTPDAYLKRMQNNIDLLKDYAEHSISQQ